MRLQSVRTHGTPPGEGTSLPDEVTVIYDENGNEIARVRGMPPAPIPTGTGTRQPEPLPPTEKITIWDLIASIFSPWGEAGRESRWVAD